jgi:hypothetical protein
VLFGISCRARAQPTLRSYLRAETARQEGREVPPGCSMRDWISWMGILAGGAADPGRLSPWDDRQAEG